MILYIYLPSKITPSAALEFPVYQNKVVRNLKEKEEREGEREGWVNKVRR